MKTTPVTFEDLGRSVLAVPPLARDRELRASRTENARLVRHLESGGVSTLMYGGNANFYNIGLYEYAEVVQMLAEIAGAESWVIPSVGPDYGRMMDQAAVVREMDFPTVMVLPLAFPATPAGVETGIRHFVEAYGKPVIVYIKFEGYLAPEGVARLVDDGLVCGIKYAIVRDDPRRDDYLERLVDGIDRRYLVSGIGERPAIVHLRDFGLNGFTSGSVCIAPNGSARLHRAIRAGDYDAAEAIRRHFLAFEDQRDAISPLRVLHEGVRLAGIADTGPLLPMLSGLEGAEAAGVGAAAKALLAYDRELTAVSQPA